jgi:LemA protein
VESADRCCWPDLSCAPDQEQLTSTENRIAFARQFYNDELMRFNTVQATFPRNLFSGLLGFSPTALFSAQEADRVNVNVSI